jgi:hypothetical protein
MNVKNSIPQGRIWWLKLPVAPNNGDHHFSKLFNVEETKGIIHSRIYPARDVVQSVWYNISALIRCNFMIKNYVNSKITSYIYLLIFTISLWLHVKHFITLKHEKGKCEKIFFCIYRSGLSLSTHRPVTTKNTGKYDSIGDKKEKSMCTHKIS